MLLKDLTENDYAYHTREGERRVVHIDQAESGKKGYVCIGCGQEMIAYNGGTHYRRHYFGHDPKSVEHKGQCTFSNETYRHKVAKDILQQIKQIKVPAVFVGSPDGVGRPRRIRDAQIVSATTVGIEWLFFENEEGEIKYCPKSEYFEHPKRNLLIQPDVAFFDKNGKPILLIEVVATHKIDDDKRFKLKCLGLDTVSVNIPKALPEIIQQTFFSVQHTKWAYNHEQTITEYISVPGQSSAPVSSIDELPDELHEENYRCRATQIGGLIRTLEKCLDGESYRSVEGYVGGEIARVSANTERDSQRLRGLQTEHYNTIHDANSGALGRIESKSADLERRYQSKKSELEQTRNQLAERETDYIQRWHSFLKRVEEEIERIEGYIKGFGVWGSTVEGRRANINHQTELVERQIADTERATEAISLRRNSLSAIYERKAEDLDSEFQRKEAEIRTNLDAEKSRLDSEFDQADRDARSSHERYREQAVDAVGQRDSKRAPRLAGRIKELLETSGLIGIIEEKECYARSLQTARKWVKTGTWREWV